MVTVIGASPPIPTFTEAASLFAGTFQSKISSHAPYCFSVAIGAFPAARSTPPPTFHVFGSAFQPVRSRPVNRLVCPSHTFATSSAFGLVLGSSLIFTFLKWHSAPSLSNAR